MRKVVDLSHITLDPSLLFAAVDAVATHGKVHALASRAVIIEGQRYGMNEQGATADVLLSRPEIAQLARQLWDAVAAELAAQSGCEVCYKVAGAEQVVAPAAAK